MARKKSDVQKTIKCKATLCRVLYPKDKTVRDGEFQIVSMALTEPNDDIKLSEWNNFVVKGKLPSLKFNEEYEIEVKETKDNRGQICYENVMFGSMYQFKSNEELESYVKAILTDKQFNTIINNGFDFNDIFVNGNADKLKSIKGVGDKSIESLMNKFKSNLVFAEMYIQLSKFELSKTVIDTLIKKYGSATVLASKLNENPYLLIEDVNNVGFKRADELALKIGIEPHSTYRIKAFIYYFLTEQANLGHSYVKRIDMLRSLQETVGDIPVDIIKQSVKELENENGKRKIMSNSNYTMLALKSNYDLECAICDNIVRLNSVSNNYSVDDYMSKINKLEELQGWTHTDEQLDSVESMIENNVVLITAPAGAGKTSGIKAFVMTLLNTIEYAQCALSGRAGVNIAQATGVEGHTIHRLLGYNPEGGFMFNSSNQLPHDIVVLDELSMVDARMFLHLISAMKTGSKLIMLGDSSQLEAIGVGNVMYDLINSNYIKVCKYTKIHRQAEKSAIKTESFKIRNSEHIVPSNFTGNEIRGELQDLELVGYNDRQRQDGELKPTIRLIMNKYKELLDSNVDVMELCVILPTKERGSSCYVINNLVQDIVIPENKRQKSVKFGGKYGYSIFVGDKVINKQNNYKTKSATTGEETPIFNGNIGIVTDIDGRDLTIDFEGIGLIKVTGESVNSILLGYCISAHASQGSQFDYVICGLDYSHYTMLNREWVYTAMTRAKKHCTLVFETKALRLATTTSNIKDKQTFLGMLLSKLK